MAEEEAQMPQDPAAGGDAAAGAEAAAGGEGAEEKPAKKGGGIGAFLPLILMPILCAGMGLGVWFMLMKPQMDAQAKIIMDALGVAPTSGGSGDHAEGGGDHAEGGDDHAEGGDDHGGGDSHGGEAAEGEGGEADDPDEFPRGECDEVVVWQDVKPMPTSNTAEASFWLVICTSFLRKKTPKCSAHPSGDTAGCRGYSQLRTIRLHRFHRKSHALRP